MATLDRFGCNDSSYLFGEGMHIDRITVRNFRNLADLDVRLSPGTVVVGENRAGKSNLLHALRLILDPSLSYADIQLRREDFWDGLSDGTDEWDPMAAGEVIEASIDIVDFFHDAGLVAALADALVAEDPVRARLTYRFAPVDTGAEPGAGVPQYQGLVLGTADKPVSRRLRRHLHLQFLPALRDVESAIKSWRHSPLRDLLEAAARAVPEQNLTDVRHAMRGANDQVNALEQIKDLGTNISNRLVDMVGQTQAMQTELAVAPEDPLRLIRAMRLFIDGDARRHLASASLGTLNVLYLALLELGLDARVLESDIAHVVMAVEEPEAHLHPHLQRLIFRRQFDSYEKPRTVLVTTQSPHIASVADPKSLIILRSVNGQTTAATAHDANLQQPEWDDIGRYLDATRAELVFARRVMLVEGFAEQVLVPTLARVLGMDLDKLGITVCAIHGTHFSSYVRFCEALDIPWALFTDADKTDDQRVSDGDKRAAALLNLLGKKGAPDEHGIFIGCTTFEYDIVTATPGNTSHCFAALTELCAEPSQKIIASWSNQVPDYTAYMNMITNAGGKGRYAQRLALRDVYPPTYVADALTYLANQ